MFLGVRIAAVVAVGAWVVVHAFCRALVMDFHNEAGVEVAGAGVVAHTL